MEQFTITEIDGIDTLFVAGVQGEFGSDSDHAFRTGIAVSYYNDSGSIVSLASTEIISSSGPSDLQFSGNYFRVNHLIMVCILELNSVRISNVESSYSPTTLNAELIQ